MRKFLSIGALALFVLLLGVVSPTQARSGRVNWSAVVSGSVEVVIRGRNITYRNLQGPPLQRVQFNFDSTIPSSDLRVYLENRSGRGRIEIVQHPSRSNGYATVVLVEDRSSGSGNYRFTLRWDDHSGGGNGGSGGGWGGGSGGNGGGWSGGGWGDDHWSQSVPNRLQWRGYVDGTEEIKVRGSDVRWYKISGDGSWEVRHRMTNPLPFREVRVSLTKHRGRGSVYVAEQPRRSNNYTATIRVVDSAGGPDRYDFTMSW